MNYSVHEWMGPFATVFAAFCYGIFVSASFVFYNTFHLLSNRVLTS